MSNKTNINDIKNKIKNIKKKHNLDFLIPYNENLLSNDLKVNSFFLNVLSLDADKMFEYVLDALKTFGYSDIDSLWDSKEGYIFAKGTIPVCLCAHMDKVPWYHSIKKIHKYILLNKKNKPIDVILNSKQGIGGDDRCGVYAILSMLKLGHRPSVLFCMGEETGCCGSRNFVSKHNKDFLNDVNAFIQIDRRGNNDCVRYSDTNPELTETLSEFGFKHAYGSCSDISMLMPHFEISGVNLSSGYYNEHHADREYVSIFDVNNLLKRLNKILSSDLFSKKYVYKPREEFHFSNIGSPMSPNLGDYKQMSLFDDYPYIEDSYGTCDCCGEYVEKSDLVEIDSPLYDMVCKDCEKDFLKQGFIKCPSCGNLFFKETTNKDPKFLNDFCPYCGCLVEDDK